MQWFKHESDASRGTSLSAVHRKFGAEGMLAYFLLLELASQKYNNEYRALNGEKFQFDVQVLKEYLRVSRGKVPKLLEFFGELSLLSYHFSGEIYFIEIPKLRSVMNNHMTRKVETTSSQRRDDTLEKRKRENREDKKRKEYIRATDEKPEPEKTASRPSVCDQVLLSWNETVKKNDDSLPKVINLNPTRNKCITSLSKTHFKTVEDWELYFAKVFTSDFLLGKSGGSWRANFDWVLKPANATKIMEGNYDNREVKRSAPKRVNPFDFAPEETSLKFDAFEAEYQEINTEELL